jgi:hypothetical protein
MENLYDGLNVFAQVRLVSEGQKVHIQARPTFIPNAPWKVLGTMAVVSGQIVYTFYNAQEDVIGNATRADESLTSPDKKHEGGES